MISALTQNEAPTRWQNGASLSLEHALAVAVVTSGALVVESSCTLLDVVVAVIPSGALVVESASILLDMVVAVVPSGVLVVESVFILLDVVVAVVLDAAGCTAREPAHRY